MTTTVKATGAARKWTEMTLLLATKEVVPELTKIQAVANNNCVSWREYIAAGRARAMNGGKSGLLLGKHAWEAAHLSRHEVG